MFYILSGKARVGLFLSILGIHQITDFEIEEPYSPAIGWRKRRQRRTLATCPDTSEECSPMEIIETSGHLLRLTLVPSCRGGRQHFSNKHFTRLDFCLPIIYIPLSDLNDYDASVLTVDNCHK